MKIIILLPILSVLSACSIINTNPFQSKTPPKVEEKSINSDHVAAIETAEVAAIWQDNPSSGKSSNTLTKTPITQQKAVMVFKNEGVDFVLYFSYDNTDISQNNTQAIIKHANFMRNNPALKLRLEGHADERGTREYNLALGENRALSIKEVLSLYDNLTGRIQVVSFGEEKPISDLHNEEAWQKNRRVEFIYE